MSAPDLSNSSRVTPDSPRRAADLRPFLRRSQKKAAVAAMIAPDPDAAEGQRYP